MYETLDKLILEFIHANGPKPQWRIFYISSVSAEALKLAREHNKQALSIFESRIQSLKRSRKIIYKRGKPCGWDLVREVSQ